MRRIGEFPERVGRAVDSLSSLVMSASAPPPHSSATVTAGLTRRSLGALKWNYLGTGAKIASQLAIGIVLARLLGPEPFGLIAVAWLMLGLGNLIADSGLSVALVQKEQISARDIRYVFYPQAYVTESPIFTKPGFLPTIERWRADTKHFKRIQILSMARPRQGGTERVEIYEVLYDGPAA